MYLNQYWRDERLAFNAYSLLGDGPDEGDIPGYVEEEEDSRDMITLSGDFAEKIWVPDTFFANDKNRFVDSDGGFERG
jgi:gamma-aminobutyric acid receptor subunit beta